MWVRAVNKQLFNTNTASNISVERNMVGLYELTIRYIQGAVVVAYPIYSGDEVMVRRAFEVLNQAIAEGKDYCDISTVKYSDYD